MQGSDNPTFTIIWGGGGGPSKIRIIWHPGVDPPPKKYDALGRRDLRQIIMMETQILDHTSETCVEFVLFKGTHKEN